MLKQNDILFQRFRFRGRHYVCLRVDTDYALNVQTVHATPIPTESERLRDGFLARPLKRISGAELTEIQPLRARQLSGTYYPVTASPCQSLDLITPDSMDYETEQAILAMKQDVGGDTAKYACGRLHCTLDELQQFLSAEQVDATCMAIRAIEKGGGFILGDQTGVGKGRVAAAIIRYAVANTKRPPPLLHHQAEPLLRPIQGPLRPRLRALQAVHSQCNRLEHPGRGWESGVLPRRQPPGRGVRLHPMHLLPDQLG